VSRISRSDESDMTVCNASMSIESWACDLGVIGAPDPGGLGAIDLGDGSRTGAKDGVLELVEND
jgi:hypothetical protein